MSNFITNTGSAQLKTRLSILIKESQELKFLVGFFYFSGISELIESLKANPDLTLKILVGLNVDAQNYGLVEYAKRQERKELNELKTITNRFSEP